MIRPRSLAVLLICLSALLAGIVFIAYPGAAHAGQGADAPKRPALTAQQMEAFLLKARITRLRGTSVTIARRATLVDGTFTHDAHIQFVEIVPLPLQPQREGYLRLSELQEYIQWRKRKRAK